MQRELATCGGLTRDPRTRSGRPGNLANGILAGRRPDIAVPLIASLLASFSVWTGCARHEPPSIAKTPVAEVDRTTSEPQNDVPAPPTLAGNDLESIDQLVEKEYGAARTSTGTVVTSEFLSDTSADAGVRSALYTEEEAAASQLHEATEDPRTGPPHPDPALEVEEDTHRDTVTRPISFEDKMTACADWPKPALLLFLSGRQSGYIEPCGCTGLENAKGGLSRRHTLLKGLRDRGWDVACLDIGNQVRRYGVQAELKFQATTNSLRAMDYDVVGFGPDDLRLSIGELAVAVAGDQPETSLFVCANVSVLDINKRFKVIDRGGIRIGVTSVLGVAEQQRIQSDEVAMTDPGEALRQVLPALQQQNCQLLVLQAHASLEESRALAQQFPQFGIVVTAGGAGEPTLEPEIVEGTKTRMIQIGTKGVYVGVVGLYPNATPRIRYERVVLDAEFADSPQMLELFGLYQQQLKELGLTGLGLRPVRLPDSKRRFVGHEACRECHTTAMEIFENTPHFNATTSISEPTERSTIPRHHDPECLSCHVTGWNPQEFFPYESGYIDLKASLALHTNGCENCHGPGSLHVAAEQEDAVVSVEQRDALREQMKISLEAAEAKCVECHDIDNSPEFNFEDYWPEVEHYGKD